MARLFSGAVRRPLVSGLRRDVAASSAQAGVRFQKRKAGELTPYIPPLPLHNV